MKGSGASLDFACRRAWQEGPCLGLTLILRGGGGCGPLHDHAREAVKNPLQNPLAPTLSLNP